MVYLVLFMSSAIVFLLLDIVMLKNVLFPLFSERLGPQLLEDPRMGPAVIFYVMYMGGIMWFVSLPVLANGAAIQAFWNGLILGAIAYGTYEFTNYATLRSWSIEMVLVDVTWGAILTGVTAWAGVVITRAVT